MDKLDALTEVETCGSFEELNRKGLYAQIFTSHSSDASTLKVFSFIEAISGTFLKQRADEILCFVSNSLVESCLRAKFVGKTTSRALSWTLANRLMALFYWRLLDEHFEKRWDMAIGHQRAFTYLPYHLSMANLDDLAMILCDLKFLAAKCKLGLTHELMDDFDLHATYAAGSLFSISGDTSSYSSSQKSKKLRVNTAPETTSQKFLDYKLFLASNSHVLRHNPELIYQQAMNQPSSSHVSADLKKLLLEASSDTHFGLLFEWLNKTRDSDAFALIPTKVQDMHEAVCSVSLSPSGQKVACGTESCEIRLYSVATTSLIKTLQGHSGRINQTCFVDEETLCSASSDGIASM